MEGTRLLFDRWCDVEAASLVFDPAEPVSMRCQVPRAASFESLKRWNNSDVHRRRTSHAHLSLGMKRFPTRECVTHGQEPPGLQSLETSPVDDRISGAPSVMSWSEPSPSAGGCFRGMRIRHRILQRLFGTASIHLNTFRRCSTSGTHLTAQPPSLTSSRSFCFESFGHARVSAEVASGLRRWRIGMNAGSPDDFMECTAPDDRNTVATSPNTHINMDQLGCLESFQRRYLDVFQLNPT